MLVFSRLRLISIIGKLDFSVQISSPEEFLGLNLGDAHIIRNAGGLAYDLIFVFLHVSAEPVPMVYSGGRLFGPSSSHRDSLKLEIFL